MVDRSASIRHLLSSSAPTEGIVLNTEPMTPDEEYAFYADAANQVPQGPPRKRRNLTTPVPVRFPEELLEEVRRRAEADDRSVSSWIRRAVEHELRRSA